MAPKSLAVSGHALDSARSDRRPYVVRHATDRRVGAGASTTPLSTLHRFVPYRDEQILTDSIVHASALVCLLCFVCLLFAGLFGAGLSA